MKKLISLVLALAMILMVGTAFAATSTPSITINPQDDSDDVKDVKIDYVAYRILEADIDTDPTVNADGSTPAHGQVAYYVTTSDRAAELEGTGLFEISRVGTENKWYVALKSNTTTAQALVDAFSAESFDLSKFESKTFSKATSASNATSGEVYPGYYYITSTLGSKIALQTLTAVTINEKNTYSTAEKTIPEADLNSEIGHPITYTLTVNVPASANQEIVLTDTMSKGLTFVGIVSDSGNGLHSEVTSAANGATQFTITYSAEKVKEIAATTDHTITVEVEVEVNKDAIVETNIPNTLDLNYGNVYSAQPQTVNTKTYKALFNKVDNNNKQLSGAEFKLTTKADNTKESTTGWISLVEETEGESYRLATSKDTNTTSVIKTNGNTVTIKGLDLDLTYYLVETKEPTGFNILKDPVELNKNEELTAFAITNVINQKGVELPSTGGIGTTIFYILGGVLVIGAAVILIARRKAHD